MKLAVAWMKSANVYYCRSLTFSLLKREPSLETLVAKRSLKLNPIFKLFHAISPDLLTDSNRSDSWNFS